MCLKKSQIFRHFFNYHENCWIFEIKTCFYWILISDSKSVNAVVIWCWSFQIGLSDFQNDLHSNFYRIFSDHNLDFNGGKLDLINRVVQIFFIWKVPPILSHILTLKTPIEDSKSRFWSSFHFLHTTRRSIDKIVKDFDSIHLRRFLQNKLIFRILNRNNFLLAFSQ